MSEDECLRRAQTAGVNVVVDAWSGFCCLIPPGRNLLARGGTLSEAFALLDALPAEEVLPGPVGLRQRGLFD